MTLAIPTLQDLRTNRVLRTFVIWLCSLSLLVPATALLSPALAAATVTTTTVLATSASTVEVGSPVTLTATVSGTAPTGNVTFKKGSTTLGTAALSGTGNTRTATFNATFTTVASNSLTAVYAGDTVNKTSTSTAKTVSSTKATATNTLSSSLNPSVSGNSVTFTATVVGYNPSGTVTFKDGTTTLGSGTLSGTGNTRSATYTKATLTVGTHSITAVYAGNTLNNTVTSNALSQVVGTKTAATSTVQTSANPAYVANPVTLTATVTGTNPTGTVTFKNGATTLGTGTLSGSGGTRTASFDSYWYSAETYVVTAVYSGDASNLAATSAPLSQVIQDKPVPAISTPSSSINPSTSNEAVTFTVSVTGISPTGLVNWWDGTTQIGSSTLVGTGNTKAATFTTSALSAASHQIMAVYDGDSTNNSAASQALAQVVIAPTPTVTVASSANPSISGAAVTFTATVTGSNPTGTAVFKEGATTLGTSTLTGTGNTRTASFTTSALSSGAHTITATYSGDGSNSTSTSSAFNQVINLATPSVVLTSSANPSVFSSNFDLNVSVTGNAPTGTVTLKDGVTTLITLTLTGGSGNTRLTGVGFSALSVGSHNITATYNGDANNATGSSNTVVQVVSKFQPSIALTSDANPALPASAVKFTASITGNLGGTMNFYDQVAGTGNVLIGSGTINSPTGGVAELSIGTLAGGNHSIVAIFDGDTNNSTATSNVLVQVINPSASTTTLTSSVNPSVAGVATSLTATVTGTVPSGEVTFKDDTTVLGTAILSGSGNSRTAILQTAPLGAGTHSLSAVYSGDASNITSTSAVLSQVVNLSSTTTTLSSNSTSPTAGQAITFTATISGSNSSGTVTFKRGGVAVGTSAVTAGTASLVTSAFETGSYDVTAEYSGDSANLPSTSSIWLQTVGQAVSSVMVSSNANPTTPGYTVTFAVAVAGFQPSGLVSLMENGVSIASANLQGGIAGLTTNSANLFRSFNAGTHSLTVAYSGDANNAAASSIVLPLVVTASPTNVVLTSDTNPALPGVPINLTAVVNGGGEPSVGTVSFMNGSTLMGTVDLLGGPVVFNTGALAIGSYNITAVYSGDGTNNEPSTSSVLVQVVATAATTTSLSSGTNPAAPDSDVTFTATVTGNAPTGTVTFLDGASTLGSGTVANGVASLTISTLGLGTHSITAVYAGDTGNAASTSAALTQTINAALVGNPMTWQYGYDAMGRPTITTDPYGRSVYTYYDSLGRPIQTQQAVGSEQSIISLEYNAADGLTKVTDPRSLQTTYSPTGLGTVVSQTSPDTGTANATFDAKRNLTSRTDARGKVTTYSYDVLDRLSTIHYASGVDTTLEYDGGASPTPAAAGELTKFTDESGQTTYGYDSAGRLITKTQVTNGKTFVVSYTWGDTGSALDKLTSITYPSGNRVNYSYDAQGAVSGITVNTVNANGVGTSGTASPLLSGITWNAANAITGWVWSSGKTQTLGYDQYGQMNSYKLGDPAGAGISAGSQRTLNYDGAGRIVGFSHTSNGVAYPVLDQTFAYDDLTRLISASLASSAIQYSYDLNGNRTAKVISGTAYNNTVSPTSNKLTQTQDVGGTNTVQYDAAGNVTNDGVNTYTYSDRGRLSSVTTAGGVVNYRYNALELRTFKSGPSAMIPTGEAYYVYDETGKVLGEYDANNTPIYETIYLNASPVGVLKQSGTAAQSDIATMLHNVYADHLATPRVITRATDEAIVWRWDSAEAFGATMPEQNPNSIGTFAFNQRLPGQVFDAETGLFQNHHREYNARLGRYIQSDPIGLRGGINTFAYVGGNPLSRIDPTGKIPAALVAAAVGAVFGTASGVYGAATSGGTLQDMAIAGGVGFVGGAVAGAAALVGNAGFWGSAVINFGVNAQMNLVGQGITYNNADPCRKPKLNLGAALGSGLASMFGGAFGPFAGEALGAVVGAAAVGFPADLAINTAASSLSPTQNFDKPCSCP